MLRTTLLAPLLPLVCFVVAAPAAAEPASVTFSRRGPAEGDQVEQTIAVDFRLKTTTRIGKQVLEESETRLRRDHQRVVTTTSAGGGRPREATVDYRAAQRTVNDGPAQKEPVVGKRYRCVREGGDLLITTAEGALPPMDEYKIVARNMETLGKRNPLADYFDGRKIAVGDRVELPIALAAELLGFEDKFAAAKRFTLTLKRVVEVDGQRCAVFDTEIEAGSGTTGQMGLVVAGPMVMQVVGCRAVSAELAGPIGMSETHVAGGQAVQVSGVGKLRVAINTRYRDAR